MKTFENTRIYRLPAAVRRTGNEGRASSPVEQWPVLDGRNTRLPLNVPKLQARKN
jgi:hypothetical protein